MPVIRTLVVARNLPRPSNGGADLRVLRIVESLAALGSVACFGLHREADPPAAPRGVSGWATASVAGLAAGPVASAGALGWLRRPGGHPSDAWFAPAAADELAAFVAGFRPDVVVVDQIWLRNYFEPARSTGARVVLNTHNVEALLQERLAAAQERPFLARLVERTRELERAAVAVVDQVWACSELDAESFVRSYPGCAPVRVVPNAVDVAAYPPPAPAAGNAVLFAGVFAYPPNAVAGAFLVERVLPLVPEARLLLVGREPPSALVEAAARDTRVVVTGAVPDVRPYLASATALAVPLFEGGGTRFKILEAFAARVPVVTTAKGAEGLDVVDGEHVLLAEAPEEFAEQLRRVWGDGALRAGLVERAYELVCARYSADAVRDAVRGAVDALLPG